jgi:hypothetical protein
MTRTRTILTALLILALASCTLGGRSTPPPASVDLSGAAALYLQAGPSSRSITAPDGAVLMKLLTAGTTGVATFQDAEGQPVTVTITRTLQLSADYLLAELDYGETPLVALVTLATGELRGLPAPVDNWERIRVAGNTAYYVSGGAITRVALDTLSAVDMSQGDRISGNSLVFLDASLNVHTVNITTGSVSPANQVRVYYADGSPFLSTGWGSPDGVLFSENHIEDRASGKLYRVRVTTEGLVAAPYTLNESGIFLGTDAVLDASLTSAHERISSATGAAFLEDMIYGDATHAARVEVDSAGDITGLTVRTLTASMYDRPRAYDGSKLYVAYESGDVVSVDIAGGAEAVLTADTGITALEVVAGDIFYSTDSGTYRYSIAEDTTELYSADPAEILAVTR